MSDDLVDREYLAGFAARLNEVLDGKAGELKTDGKPLIRRGYGRDSDLGELMGVSYKAAGNWLRGLSFPSMTNVLRLAVWGGVCVEWLLTGRGPKHPPESQPAEITAALEAMASMSPDARAVLLSMLAGARTAALPSQTMRND